MGWHGELALDDRRAAGRTIVRDRHDGPLRVLRALHPEGGVCHSVLVHPPGGIVRGDVLAITATLGESAHVLVTTPAATRFYRSAGASASQSLDVVAAARSRLEWLPLETFTKSDRFVINKTDLAPHVGATREALRPDTMHMRGTKPFVMTNLKTRDGLAEVVAFIEQRGMLRPAANAG